MRVTKAQANRAHIVETASTLFRERRYDGVGVADLMAAAATCGFSQTAQRTTGNNVASFIDYYISRNHRDERGTGCTMAALCGDAVRQSEAVKATFADGIERLLADLECDDGSLEGAEHHEARADILDTLAHLVGVIALARACPDDSPLADEILEACRTKMLASRQPMRPTRR